MKWFFMLPLYLCTVLCCPFVACHAVLQQVYNTMHYVAKLHAYPL